MRANVLVCPDMEIPVIEAADFHPLIAAAALAFKRHYPLVLSPDILWITILQGVAQHVSNHANGLRQRLVQHETKIELVVDTDLRGLPANDAEMLGLVSEFLERMGRHLVPDKRFLAGAEFSTTTDAARIAGCVTFMDAMQPYFDYVFMCVCGIPSVTLEGTPEDWELLRTKVHALHESDMELSWWTRHLLPLTDHFVRASRGDVDRIHWQNLCKVMERYGTEDLNGWLLKFIPYTRKGKNEPFIQRNPVLEFTEYSDTANSTFEITGCTSDMLPTGLSRAPMTCMNKADGSREQFDFAAGFIGVTQNPDDLGLKATIGWAIAECARIDGLISRLRAEHEVAPPSAADIETILDHFGGYLPDDLGRFYTQTNGATIEGPCSRLRYRLLPLQEILPAQSTAASSVRIANALRGMWGPAPRGNGGQTYEKLLRIASCENGTHYVFGQDPALNQDKAVKRSRGEVFQWTGEFKPEAFTPVAHTFSDWLEKLLREG